jgi:hypothetical protein
VLRHFDDPQVAEPQVADPQVADPQVAELSKCLPFFIVLSIVPD